MKKWKSKVQRIFFSSLFLAALQGLHAQQHEIGLGGGVAYYTGDINWVHFRAAKENIHGFYRFVTPLTRWNFRAHFAYSHIAGQDAAAGNAFQTDRNLVFDTRIYQIAALAEFNFLPFSTIATNAPNYPITPYLALGVSLFYFKPTGTTNFGVGNLYTADPENASFNDVAFALPVGLGLKVRLADNWGMGIEYLINVPFTAYLDGVKTRGNGVLTDLFYQLGVHFYYTISNNDKACVCLKKR